MSAGRAGQDSAAAGNAAAGDFDVDLFVIGAGSGGVRAARLTALGGKKVAVAEEYRVGGTCVIRGCVPKKLFVHAAHYAEDFHDAAGFGWHLGGAQGHRAQQGFGRPRRCHHQGRPPQGTPAGSGETEGRVLRRKRPDHQHRFL